MTTMLAHIRVRPGKEQAWEATMRELVRQTIAHEPDVLRYEYWKGQEPLCYYGLLSFKSKRAFFEHQDADYHRTPPFADMIADIRLEFVDPVEAASPLPHTENPELPADTPASVREWENLTPIQLADWWLGRA